MGGVLSRICHSEQYGRIDSNASGALNSRLAYAESSIRHDRHRATQQEKDASSDDAIELRLVDKIDTKL